MARNQPLARINLNVFSNVASPDARDCLAPEAIRSFFECFGGARGAAETITRVFCDPKPHRGNFEAWKQAIRDGTPGIPLEIVETGGLIDSFARSLEISECEYAVQLEHDFVFIRSRIPHGLPEIVGEMAEGGFNFVRFNKRQNIRQGYDMFLDEMPGTEVPMCRVNGRSNNPQAINVAFYRREVLPILRGPDGMAIGLEGGLCRLFGGGQVYGGLGWPKTVQHLDGRDVRFRDRLARKLHFWKRSLSGAKQVSGAA
ncbi:MAG: hypothetical protein IOC52_08530 [Methylobacterium sp.]|nr:hypothetical protein [Methylobacterium sp.]